MASMDSSKIAYLIGAGATKGELDLQGIEADPTMAGINRSIFSMSDKTKGPYSKMVKKLRISETQDVEFMMSLFEAVPEKYRKEFSEVSKELRLLVRRYINSQILEKGVRARLSSTLLHLHKTYPDSMGKTGEELLGVITTNYDSIWDMAFVQVHESLNCVLPFRSKEFEMKESTPPLLKLHGSFNWKVLKAQKDTIQISSEFEAKEPQSHKPAWVPPSTYKNPAQGTFTPIWDKARELLVQCNVLRVIGSSLRTEDIALISLIFTSQMRAKDPFTIEFILPDTVTRGDNVWKGIIQRLPFLRKPVSLSELPVFEVGDEPGSNPYKYWLDKKIREIEKKDSKLTTDKIIINNLYGGN